MAGNGREHKSTLHRVVTVLVAAVVAFCALMSGGQEGSLLDNLPGSELLQSILDELGLGGGSQSSMENAVMVSGELPDAKLQVHFLDMGQADSILIKGPIRNVLIDAGENEQGNDVIRYLKAQEVETIHYAIGTHPHSDHIGGLDTVITGMEVKNVILPVIPDELVPANRTYTDLLQAILDKGLKITAAKPGKSYDLGDGATLTILGPIGEYSDLNNMSVVCRLTYGDTAFVFTGDACVAAEADILDRRGDQLAADVLDMGHHGSSTSSCDEFLNAVSPRFAVISCGVDNSYGHPHRETMEKLSARDIQVLRTDQNGAVVFWSNGTEVSAGTQR